MIIPVIEIEEVRNRHKQSWHPGHLQFYINYYDCERCIKDDNPKLGLILCTDKNDAVVRYTLGTDKQKKIVASCYKLHLPTEMELKAELRREMKKCARRNKEK